MPSGELALQIWRSKYRYLGIGNESPERSIADTWRRVAKAVAGNEGEDASSWERAFYESLQSLRFLPAGRILAGAGTHHRTTLFNCFVMGYIEDSLEGILGQLGDAAITMQRGGGIGVDFSTLRPKGAKAIASGTTASGPVSFMNLWDAMCATLLSTGARRGAMMGTLRCDHPDIEAFIDAKRQKGVLTNFNLSVQVTDDFMQAVADDSEWTLCFPMEVAAADGSGQVKRVHWPGHASDTPCEEFERVSARKLWGSLMGAVYETAEPGVLFVDRINRLNNLHYRERITTTNPCGEIPLPEYGACDLGSINLTAFVEHAFTQEARLDHQRIAETAAVAVRFLDNVIDVSEFPLPRQGEEARGSRRIGLGITGLGDALIMLGLDYGSDRGRAAAENVLRVIRDAACRASIELAREKGGFPYLETEPFLGGAYVAELPGDIRDGIARHGIRNSHLIAIAPTGTISLLANNVSSGIEPVFALEAERRILSREGTFEIHRTVDHALELWQRESRPGDSLPASFVTAKDLSPEAHLDMQAVLQPLVDNSISKTINVPEAISKDELASVYRRAYELGLKGCTVFRPNPVTGAILSDVEIGPPPSHCCAPEREGD